MADVLDLAILDAGKNIPAVALARCGSNVAVAALPHGAQLDALAAFRDHIDDALHATKKKPSETELTQFGHSLFNYVIRDDVERLYEHLPTDAMVRVHILCNKAEIQSLPWEFMQDPKQAPGPWLARTVVRIVPTINVRPPEPLRLGEGSPKIKILFAFADPVDQDPVSWTLVRDSIERALAVRIPTSRYELKVIDANPRDLTEALQENTYEIFHFCGHGNVGADGEGYLDFIDRTTDKRIPFSAKKLSKTLRNRGIRLVILSACYTATSKKDERDRFAITAEALVNSHIPAVVANQLPFPDLTTATFVEPLYKQLLKTGDIDEAVSEARMTLANDLALAGLEWGVPTVYRHIAGAQVFLP
jgi:CHAT domain-containing protein